MVSQVYSYPVEGPDHVAHEDTRLPPIGSQEHQGALLAGGQDASVVPEAGEVDCHDGSDSALAATPADDDPPLSRRAPGRGLAGGVGPDSGLVSLMHWETEESG
jgi:hypothetical protein